MCNEVDVQEIQRLERLDEARKLREITELRKKTESQEDKIQDLKLKVEELTRKLAQAQAQDGQYEKEQQEL